MDLKNKTKNIVQDVGKTYTAIKKLEFADLWKFYQKIFKRVPDILHLKNIVIFSLVASVIALILFGQRFASLESYLPKEPISGGVYTEGIVGQIEQLNPLFSANNSAESAAVSLIFSGLTKRNNQRASVPDLASGWIVSADEKTYTFQLKEGLFWHDGQPLSVDDIIFTIESIQNPDTKSPLLTVWKGVTVKKINDREVAFVLPNPSAGFLGNTNFSVLPKHILASIPARSLVSSEFSLSPVGSGPYQFGEIKNIKESQELILNSNQNYYGQVPYIEKVILKTYRNFDQLSSAYSRREISGIERVPAQDLDKREQLPNIQTYNLSIPEYEVIYLNLRSEIMKDAVLRQAVNLATPRLKIVEDVYSGEALPIHLPVLTGYAGYNPKLKLVQDIPQAKAKLTGAGYVMGADGIFAKGDKRASLRLVILNNSEKSRIAEVFKDSLKEAGIEIVVEKYQFASYIQDYVRARDFDAILVTQNLGTDSDIYSFWHSSGVNDPGLNLTGLNDRRLDKFLEQGRTMLLKNKAEREAKYKDISQVIFDSNSAIYLVWPNYIYGVSKDVKGLESGRFVDPRDRFWNIESWYINDKHSTVL